MYPFVHKMSSLIAWLKRMSKRRQGDNQSVADPSSKSQSAAPLSKKSCSCNDSWEKEFKWLYFHHETNSMKCRCCETKKTTSNSNSQECNAFADRSRIFQKSGLVWHGRSDHQLTEAAEQRQKELTTAVIKVNEISSRALYAQMGAALILARGDLLDTKFSSLLDTQVKY